MRLKKKRNLKVIIYPAIFLILICNINLGEIELKNSNETFINEILGNSNAHLIKEKNNTNLLYEFVNTFNNIELKKPYSILAKTFVSKNEETLQTFSYIQNMVVSSPRIYIYSTHPTEGFVGEKNEEYNMNPNIVLASLILQEKLNAVGIPTVVEERSAADYIKEHNIDYKYSYVATREFLTNKLKQQSDFDLIIDLHRDAVSKSISTVTINNKNYAKILFVMNKNFPNIELAKEFNNIINEKYPGLSRGIYDKYNDDFNQDLHENVILLELGANYNTFDEVENTIDALVESIKELLK